MTRISTSNLASSSGRLFGTLFFKAPQPIPGPEDPLGDLMFDVTDYGLHVASSLSEPLRKAVSERFGECHLGCIH